MGQKGFGAHFGAKLVSQFMQTKFLCHKMSQKSAVFLVLYSRDCTYLLSSVGFGLRFLCGMASMTISRLNMAYVINVAFMIDANVLIKN